MLYAAFMKRRAERYRTIHARPLTHHYGTIEGEAELMRLQARPFQGFKVWRPFADARTRIACGNNVEYSEEKPRVFKRL